MRIWDVPVQCLCRKHLLGEHRELHCIWDIYNEGNEGYRNHPETRRWHGKLMALYLRHEAEVKEMERRGWKGHKSPLHFANPVDIYFSKMFQNEYVTPIEEQYEMLRKKDCECLLECD